MSINTVYIILAWATLLVWIPYSPAFYWPWTKGIFWISYVLVSMVVVLVGFVLILLSDRRNIKIVGLLIACVVSILSMCHTFYFLNQQYRDQSYINSLKKYHPSEAEEATELGDQAATPLSNSTATTIPCG